jgi:hypothetical protein
MVFGAKRVKTTRLGIFYSGSILVQFRPIVLVDPFRGVGPGDGGMLTSLKA